MPRPRKPDVDKVVGVHTTLDYPIWKAAKAQEVNFASALKAGVMQELAKNPEYTKNQRIREIDGIKTDLQRLIRDFEEELGENYEQASKLLKSRQIEAEKTNADMQAKADAAKISLEQRIYSYIRRDGRSPHKPRDLAWFEDWYDQLKTQGWTDSPIEVMSALIVKGEKEGWT